MTKLYRFSARALVLLAIVAWVLPSVARAQSNAVADLAARINRERLARGLAPLALNAKLMAAAQAHADDIARTAQFGHTGSDGSSATIRVARAGYGKYSWGYRVGENWARYHSVADAFAMWMESAPHRNNILHPVYREVGIGVAATSAGGFVYILNFGAQPNVLPIFINDAATETKSPEVKLTLTTEDVMAAGDGDSIGRPTQVQISNTPDFVGAKWQEYAASIVWTLAPGGGAKTVYVKYRDAKGRSATASDSITLGAPATATATKPPATRTSTRAPIVTATLAFTPTPSATPTETPTLTPTPTETPTLAPTATPTIAPTESDGAVAASHAPAPTLAPEADTATVKPDFAALGFFGISVMAMVLGIVKFLATR